MIVIDIIDDAALDPGSWPSALETVTAAALCAREAVAHMRRNAL